MAVEPTYRWRTIADGLKAGRIIPFLGAGASSFACGQQHNPPSGSKLLATLAEEAELGLYCSKNCDRPLYDLSRVASYYQLVRESRRELDRRLGQLTGDPACDPNKLHHMLARVARSQPLLIVTTNYDALLEKAFDQLGVSYDVVATAADRLSYRGFEEDDDASGDDGGMIYHRLGGTKDFHPVDPRELPLDLKVRSIIYKVHGKRPEQRKLGGWVSHRGGGLHAIPGSHGPRPYLSHQDQDHYAGEGGAA